MMLRRYAARAISQVGAREFEGIAATSALQPDGFALVMSGADLSRLSNSGALLWNHNANAIVGRIVSVRTTSSELKFRGTFAGAGISATADEVCGLLKDGIINGISLGFEVLEKEPIDSRDPRKGVRAKKWIAYEISLVSVPMDAAASVTARSHQRPYGVAFPSRTERARAVTELDRGGRRQALTELEIAGQGIPAGQAAPSFAERQRTLNELRRPHRG